MVKVEQASPDPNSENCKVDEEWFTFKGKQYKYE